MENRKFTQLFNICPFYTLWISQFQQMLNNWVNLWFSIIKNLWDLAQENLVNKQGSYGILDLWVNQLKNDSYC